MKRGQIWSRNSVNVPVTPVLEMQLGRPDSNDLDDDIRISWTANIFHRDLYNDYPKFAGSFSNDFVASNCVPHSLVNFVEFRNRITSWQ